MRYVVPMLLVAIGCGGAAATSAPTRTVVIERIVVERPSDDPEEPVDASSPYRAGAAVEVEYGGTWYPASVRAVLPDGRVEIAYDGYGEEWNELVGPARIRQPGEPPGAEVPDPQQLPKDTPIFVEWRGHWYPGRVRAVTPDGEIEIAYDGYDDQWNEVVGPARVRLTGS
jgi:acylphosphatase